MTPAAGPRADPHQANALRQFARFSGLATISVAAAALVGWGLDIELLKTVLPGHATMKANTALGLLLSSAALLASLSERPRAPEVAAGLSIAVLLLGCAVLLEYGSGIVTGLDTMLFDDPAASAEGRVPGRISEISALSFVLLGWRGLEARAMSRVWLGQVLALGLVAIGLFALSAYGYAMGTGTREAPFNPISVHTAILLLMMGLGWLASLPERGLMRVISADSFGGELARRTLLPALLIPAILSYLAQLPGTRREHALGVAERIVDDIRGSEWPFRPVTASVGVAEAVMDEATTALVARADAALYAAKQAGRARALAAPPQSGE